MQFAAVWKSVMDEGAGSSRQSHTSVMADEAVSLMGVRPGGVWIDATLGGGGHAAMILEKSAPDGILLGIDRDPEAVERCTARFAPFGKRFRAVNADFGDLEAVIRESGIGKADGIMADLGLSTLQLDEASRGFSFSRPGPLDMRFNRHSGITAMELLKQSDEAGIAEIIKNFGEERESGKIARAIRNGLSDGRIKDTAGLAGAIFGVMGRRGRIHPATRTFQALRIAVNGELESLEKFLGSLPLVLKPGGRAVVISFHSLEDRMVKKSFADLTAGCRCPKDLPVCVCGVKPRARRLTSGTLKPSGGEIEKNPRARSARLRAIQMNGGGT